ARVRPPSTTKPTTARRRLLFRSRVRTAKLRPSEGSFFLGVKSGFLSWSLAGLIHPSSGDVPQARDAGNQGREPLFLKNPGSTSPRALLVEVATSYINSSPTRVDRSQKLNSLQQTIDKSRFSTLT